MGALYLGFYFSTVEAIAPNSTKIIIEMHADFILISYLPAFINNFGNSKKNLRRVSAWTPLGELTELPRPVTWWGGGSLSLSQRTLSSLSAFRPRTPARSAAARRKHVATTFCCKVVPMIADVE